MKSKNKAEVSPAQSGSNATWGKYSSDQFNSLPFWAREEIDDLTRSNRHLLEALKELLKTEESPHTETVRFLAREQARAVIAKAERGE